MATPTQYKLTVYCKRGDAYSDRFRWLLPDEDGVATPVDLDGYTARAHLREDADDEEPLAMFTVTLEGEGWIRLQLPSDNTAELEPGKYVFDVELTNEDDEPYTPFGGSFQVLADATHG